MGNSVHGTLHGYSYMDVGGDLDLGDIFETLEDYHEPDLAPIHHDGWNGSEPVFFLPSSLDADSLLTLPGDSVGSGHLNLHRHLIHGSNSSQRDALAVVLNPLDPTHSQFCKYKYVNMLL